jgi:hypothetical protein
VEGRCRNFGEGSGREGENAELKGEVELLKDEIERLRELVGEVAMRRVAMRRVAIGRVAIGRVAMGLRTRMGMQIRARGRRRTERAGTRIRAEGRTKPSTHARMRRKSNPPGRRYAKLHIRVLGAKDGNHSTGPEPSSACRLER